ncbi:MULTISPECIES: hypothetical protein [unclassified Methylophaga]|uniref:hypothetical protein n=1 Tax=unclassified Methylophaga TaxID=2629249 RepID=UPI0023B410F0|nr:MULTISPECIES: hypothetical protein [unclassified Methylophaga]
MKLTIRRSFPRYNYHYQYKSAQTSEKLFVVEIPPPIKLAGHYYWPESVYPQINLPRVCMSKFLSDDITRYRCDRWMADSILLG